MTITTIHPTAPSIHDLETELLGLAGNLAAAECRFLLLLAEFDQRGGWAGPGLKSCAHWLSWRIGMSLRTATEHVRVAHALVRLPKITEAFAAGRISYSKVRAITRIAGRPTPDPTDPWPGSAPRTAQGSGTNAVPVDPREPDPGSTDPSSPRRGRGDDRGRGDNSRGDDRASGGSDSERLPATPPADPQADDPGLIEPGPDAKAPHAGHPAQQPRPEIPPLADDAEQVLLDLALTGTASHVEKIVRATRRAQTDPSRHTALRALSWHHDDDGALILRGRFTPDDGALLVATIEALVEPPNHTPQPGPPPPQGWQDTGREHAPGAVDDRIAARRADALLALVCGTAGDDGPAVARDRAQVIVHIDAATGAARIENGPEIPAATAERIACDADAQALLHDTKRNRLYLGRRRRLATPAQTAALTVRDGPGCRFPGCSHARHLRAHHVRHWFHNGDTNLDNLVLLCAFHHRLLHDLRYQLRREHGRWVFERPDGSPIPKAGPPLDGNTESLLELNTRAGLRITRDSLTPDWGGERLDPTPILERLLPRRRPAAA